MNKKRELDVNAFVQRTAKVYGWEVQPDKTFLDELVEGLEKNLERLGYLQCPCRLSWDDRTKDRDIICPCTYAAADIDEYGHCFCALFCSSEFIKKGLEPTSIPERRPEHLYP
ncbi:MAG: ferredoxin-thioredoxin reductase catalytic domain-containing protein [Sphaerochaetaceae bacterium]|jgi:ferredoxin-thioredoxin reductase catalytic subunit|nr:ferredoxin-thioredoxin reductase catalytic domain-containing protein [Sphaerochaetaceae bacterium]MDD3365772.1 ferredoxin-thioredoxin reductase catalytic domain-containing protein [Sphaerochaetaceae bacterium]MDD4220138.1 ferredoxin-thioredoxin reductase catalytic domain-containing protein [Sphaerochaetaceae bacterium]MDY0370812.1 ferredoxin-thioredoxin reductase catalytic domain-containing protein [Sphaerochaetaceae bacterium]